MYIRKNPFFALSDILCVDCVDIRKHFFYHALVRRVQGITMYFNCSVDVYEKNTKVLYMEKIMYYAYLLYP